MPWYNFIANSISGAARTEEKQYDDDAVDDVDDDDHLDDLVVGQDASLLLGNTPLHDLDDKYKIIFSRNSAASLTP